MQQQQWQQLQQFLGIASPSGSEAAIGRAYREMLAPVAQDIRRDAMGNVIASLEATGSSQEALRVMLAGHCDEIGFMVQHIDDNGFLYFAAIGGVDPHWVPGQRLWIHTAQGPIAGVVGKKPVHHMEAEEKKKVVPLHQQFIDIGAANKEEAEELVAVGDSITVAAEVFPLQGDRVAARGFDDRVGAFIVAEALRRLAQAGEERSYALYSVATTQEEVGLRGARTSAFGVDPQVGIAVDVGFASDHPQVEKSRLGDIALGQGPIIPRGPNIAPWLFELLRDTARQQEIPFQVWAAPRPTGTDANSMQISREGVATALVKIPLRYMHTPVEVLSLADVEHAIQLLQAVMPRLPAAYAAAVANA